MKNKLLISLLLLTWTAMPAIAGKEEEQQIKTRQSAYIFLGWNTNRIKSQVVDYPKTFNKDEVQAAANVIAAIANSGLGKLYGPGTDEGVGWKKTRLNPEFFQKQEEARKIAITFNQEANELAKVAASGDIFAIKNQFGKLSESCKSCHDSFRLRESF
ncbi:Cytochrome c' [Methylophilaceae bacterium]|nr:Cytochrome c' [Methylophilaceae bacterium]